MDTRYRLRMKSDAAGLQLAELTIQSELTLLVGKNELDILNSSLDGLEFGEVIRQIRYIVGEEIRIPEELRKNYETAFISVPDTEARKVDGALLDRIADAFREKFFVRCEGECPNTALVMGRANRTMRVALNDGNIPTILDKLNIEFADPAIEAEEKGIVQNIIEHVICAKQQWVSYRECLDAMDRASAQRAERDRSDRQRDGERSGRNDDSRGGPAADGAMDRAGRSC